MNLTVSMSAVVALVLAGALSAMLFAASPQDRDRGEPTQDTPEETPQENQPAPSADDSDAAAPEANPDDVASVDAIVAALYDVISGPAGKKRDWDRFRSLFVPKHGQLVPAYGRGAQLPVWSVEDYIARNRAYLEREGFFEREAARRAEQFGLIAHVFSTYESRHTAEDAEPFQLGINSIQLVKRADRWWILSVVWDAERAGQPIPERYAPDVVPDGDDAPGESDGESNDDDSINDD